MGVLDVWRFRVHGMSVGFTKGGIPLGNSGREADGKTPPGDRNARSEKRFPAASKKRAIWRANHSLKRKKRHPRAKNTTPRDSETRGLIGPSLPRTQLHFQLH
jgi:hypothetical protein